MVEADTTEPVDSQPVDQLPLTYQPIILEQGFETGTGFPGLVTSDDNGETKILEYTSSGKVYHQRDGDRIWQYIEPKIKLMLPTISSAVNWANILDKPDLALKSDLTWDNLQNKPTLLKGDPGLPGKDGQAATVTVGRVTTGATVSVKNSGTATNAVLDFVLPEGSSDHSGEGTADALSVGVIAQIVRDHVFFDVNMQTGNLEMTVVDVPQTTIANQVAKAIMSKLSFVILDNGDLQVTTGGD